MEILEYGLWVSKVYGFACHSCSANFAYSDVGDMADGMTNLKQPTPELLDSILSELVALQDWSGMAGLFVDDCLLPEIGSLAYVIRAELRSYWLVVDVILSIEINERHLIYDPGSP